MNTGRSKILVWDFPTRVFHWTLVLCFAAAWLSAESERWRLVHVTAGYTMAGLVTFRLVWGMVGSRYARFNSFITGPAKLVSYIRAAIERQPEHYVGHNPVGALAVLALLFLIAGLTLTGYVLYNDLSWFKAEAAHDILANGMLGIVFLHISGVIFSSWLHQENLVRAMVTGYKLGLKSQSISKNRIIVGVLVSLSCILFLVWQFKPNLFLA